MAMIAIVVLGPSGLATGRRIAAALPGAELHGFAPRVAEADVAFDETAEHLRDLFRTGQPIIGVCAAGVLIRSLAPLLADKHSEPPVVAVAEDGRVAVPLLGGHHGANDLAGRIAEILDGVAAVTTAGDRRFGLALDAPPPGWRVANEGAVKPVTAALLAGEAVGLSVEAAEEDCGWLRKAPFTESATPTAIARQGGGGCHVLVTDRSAAPDPQTLVLHPATLALGIGCERHAPPEEVIGLARRCLDESGLAPQSVACVVSIALKAAEPAIHALAAELGVPARFFDAATLKAEAPRLANPSDLVFRETGCHGVAEGAALAAAGAAGRLVLPKIRSARATCAIAQSPHIIDPEAIGRARGRLAIVGIGPGDAAARTPEATAALKAATDLVGYRLYLDLLGDLTRGKPLHGYDLGEETARVRVALALAAAGREVALVCSGDAGIYAMGSLVYEQIERSGDPDWERVDIVGIPGISAMQAAAARIGAPLGHDFCAISLSDLLTPWDVIEQRLKAAAAGDFVVAFYNPVSQRRRTQLATAREILLAARPAETPVVLARNLGREGERVTVTTLDSLDPEMVDMLTLVLIGSSATRAVPRPDGGAWVYTPRGYDRKNGDSA
ncbi:precorrin-3B C(17)-methyltransferase [Rhodospirillaceae bacterium SYSU D60014]|uniref:precorrin-3B C(17)-methyltransferase n=1 Tax=Virgifigura deserti TaxID=2268457 RepID=UPI000E66E30F